MQIAMLGIDLGKNNCSVVGLDSNGTVVTRRRMRPQSIAAVAEQLPSRLVAMEACCGAHHLGRLLRRQSHQVRLMSPEYVRPCLKSKKNEDRDAEVIAEAATRLTMRFVELSQHHAGPGQSRSVAKDAEPLFWKSTADSRDLSDSHEYLSKFPNGFYAGLARNRIRQLDGSSSAPPAPVAQRAPSQAAARESEEQLDMLESAIGWWASGPR